MPPIDEPRLSYDELSALVVRQAGTISRQAEIIARQQEITDQLEATVERLSARVAELERRLNRNSGNSSLPPSSDTFTRPEKRPHPAGERKRGRQPGAPGSALTMVDVPDHIEDHLPAA
jgi:transposase